MLILIPILIPVAIYIWLWAILARLSAVLGILLGIPVMIVLGAIGFGLMGKVGTWIPWIALVGYGIYILSRGSSTSSELSENRPVTDVNRLYGALRENLAYWQVAERAGCHGIELSRSKDWQGESISYAWADASGKRLYAHFEDEQLKTWRLS
jgi:hypothetical protein